MKRLRSAGPHPDAMAGDLISADHRSAWKFGDRLVFAKADFGLFSFATTLQKNEG
jgi:hypothetical protein